jgi:YVTN family beta-propeller protein
MVYAPYVILTVLLIGTLSALPMISYYHHQAYAQTVIDTVTVGDIPRGIDVNPATNRVYVANQGDGTVSVIDGTTNTVIATVDVGNSPRGVGVNPATNRVYVTNLDDGTVSVIDGTTNTVIATVDVGNLPFDIAVNPATDRVYVANQGDGTVSVIDGTTNTVIATVRVGGGFIGGIDVNPDTNRIYVGMLVSGETDRSVVSVIDGTTNTVIATVDVSSEVSSDTDVNVAVNPDTNRVYVAQNVLDSRGIGIITVIDGTTNTVIATVDGPESDPVDVAVNPSTNRIYVTNALDFGASAGVYVIDGTTNEVIATIGSFSAGDVAVNPDTNRIYVTHGENEVSVIEDSPSGDDDVIPPDTTIESATDGDGDNILDTEETFSRSIEFTFTGEDNIDDPSQLTFECRLDSTEEQDFAACTTPQEYTGLGFGEHTFEVRAVDTSGNIDPSPASFTWTIFLEADIDIKPDGDDGVSTINTNSRGITTVAILGSEEFGDVSEVDISSIEFAGATPSSTTPRFEDVNGDGITDLILKFNTQDLDELQQGDTEACLVGELNDGTPIKGCDEVRVI